MSVKITINNIVFKLNDDTKTANICDNNNACGAVFIPRSICHNNQEYIINRIEERSFHGSNVESIEFAPNSELRTIESNAFNGSNIRRLSLPSSLNCLKSGWCAETKELKKVTIQPNNKNFMNIDDKMIIGKSDSDNDEYDVLLFVRRDIEKVTIPSFIKKIDAFSFSLSSIKSIEIPQHVTDICENAFQFCVNLQKVTFQPNSELRKIGKNAFHIVSIRSISIPKHVIKIEKNCFYQCDSLEKIEIDPDSELQKIERMAFSETKIEKLVFPSNLSELESGWCDGLKNLIEIKIMENNQYFKKYNENMIVGKSDQKSDIFDILVFVNRNVNSIIIPPEIKIIASYALSYSLITQIYIPQNVTELCEGVFHNCKNLRHIEFSPDSELKIIGPVSFYKTKIERMTIPASVSTLSNRWISRAENLRVIEIDPNNQFYKKFNDKMIVGKTNSKSKDFDTLVFVNRDIKTVMSFPPNIKRIASNAFAYSSLQSISLLSSIESIGDSVFFMCTQLESIYIPENSQLVVIDHFAFVFSSIKSIFIPSKVTRISENALSFSDELEIVELDENLNIKINYGFVFSCSIVMIPVKLRGKSF